MRQITRDLYTSGRVWLSLSHSFTQNSGDGKAFDLVKSNAEGDFVTLNAGALFVLSLWSTGKKVPEKFYIPEYKIETLKQILIQLKELKADEAYVRDGELTAAGKPSTLYYRLSLSNKKYIDIYFVENDYNGDKSINIAIELDNVVYPMYDSNVLDLIDIIPSMGDIVRFKQSAAELYYMETFLLNSTTPSGKPRQSKKQQIEKKAPPRQVKEVQRVDRTEISRENISYIKEEPVVQEESNSEPDVVQALKDDNPTIESNDSNSNESGFDYSALLKDE